MPNYDVVKVVARFEVRKAFRDASFGSESAFLRFVDDSAAVAVAEVEAIEG